MIFRFHFLGILWALFVLVLGILPADMFPQNDVMDELPLDKFIHFVLYALLALFNLVGIKKHYFSGGLTYHPVIFATVTVVCYGCLVELLQNFISTRSFEWMDIVANNAGIMAGLIAFRLLYGKRLFYA